MTDNPTQPVAETPIENGARLGVGISGVNVTLRFDKPVQAFGLTPEQAHKLARLLMKTGRLVTKQIAQRKRELMKKAGRRD